MTTYFVLFIVATTASLIATPIIRRLCEHFNLLDVPLDARRVHDKAVPRLGGVAIYLSCVVALATLPIVDRLLTQSLAEQRSVIILTFIPATLVLMLGVYDDLKGTNAVVKFVALGLIATLFFLLGGRIVSLSIPLVGSVQLPLLASFLVTILWLVGIANAFNLIDGLDGLASGAALFSSLVILAVSISQGRSPMIVVAMVLCGALAGFLRYNFNPASIFLGDSGALFVGFTLAALSVTGTQKATTAVAVVVPILAFGFPMVDTAITMTRRLISRRPIFQGDNEHIHHMLLARGWSQRQVALVLYGVCAAFGLVAMVFTTTGPKATGFVMFVVTVATLIAVGHLQYHEVDEIKAGVKRTVADRRLRVANNIRVRRAARALSKASDLHDFFEAVRHMLDINEFVFVNAQVGQAGRAELNDRALQASLHRHAKPQLALQNGRVYWSWTRSDVVGTEEVQLRTSAWRFHLPLVKDGVDWGWINLYRNFDDDLLLVDTNYLVDLFRLELTAAAERIFKSHEAPPRRVELPLEMVEEVSG
ncbi:MAG TPA: MraY family glycosyltransferase [Pyrinomonadaceae bacterium]|nr:MraY family glycosyltransferase [Pyrinomonadaceae bacterium]